MEKKEVRKYVHFETAVHDQQGAFKESGHVEVSPLRNREMIIQAKLVSETPA